MKKLYLLGIALLAATFAFAQANPTISYRAENNAQYTKDGYINFTPQKRHTSMTKDAVLSEDFTNTTFPPTGWDTICSASTNASHHWSRQENLTMGSNGTQFPGQYAFINYGGPGIQQNDWLITPQITIPANGALNFDIYTLFRYWTDGAYIEPGDGDYGSFRVKISTDNGANWTSIWNEDDAYDAGTLETGEWNTVTVDLSAYNGIEVKLAFQYEAEDACWLFLDNISVSSITSVDFELSDAFVQTYPAMSVMYRGHGMYRNLPAEEVAGIFCAYEGVVTNYGTAPVEVKLTHKAYGPSDDEIFSYEYAPVTIPAAGFDENGVFTLGRDTI